MVIPIHCVQEIREAQVDWRTALGCGGGRQDHGHSVDETEFRGSQPSAVLCFSHCCAREAVNDGHETWSGLNATHDINNNGRQRARMQYLPQPKRFESMLQTTGWECDEREHEQRSGNTLDVEVKIGVICALAPPQVQNHCHLNSHIQKRYAPVRTVLFNYCRVTPCPWTARWWVRRQKARKAKATRRAKAQARKGKVKATRMRKTEVTARRAKAKAKTMPNAGYCLLCEALHQDITLRRARPLCRTCGS